MLGETASVKGGVVLAAVGLAGLLAGPGPFLAAAMLIGIAAAGGVFRLARARGESPVPLAGFAGILALYALAAAGGEDAPSLFPAAVAGAFGLTFAGPLARGRLGGTVRGAGVTLVAVLLVGLLGAYVVALRQVPFGFRLTLVLVLMAGGCEVGRLIARRRWPGNDHAGAARRWAVGALAAGLVALIASLSLDPPFTPGTAAVLAVLTAIAAPAGTRAVWLVAGPPPREETAPPESPEVTAVREPGGVAGAASAPGPESGLSGGRPTGIPRVVSDAARRVTALRAIGGLLASGPVFFYAYRVLER